MPSVFVATVSFLFPHPNVLNEPYHHQTHLFQDESDAIEWMVNTINDHVEDIWIWKDDVERYKYWSQIKTWEGLNQLIKQFYYDQVSVSLSQQMIQPSSSSKEKPLRIDLIKDIITIIPDLTLQSPISQSILMKLDISTLEKIIDELEKIKGRLNHL